MGHKKLAYRYGGRDFRLTDVFGEQLLVLSGGPASHDWPR